MLVEGSQNVIENYASYRFSFPDAENRMMEIGLTNLSIMGANGAIATRAWRHIAKYIYRGHDTRERSLEVTQAGSVEFNGDHLTGNIHWASKHELGDNRRLKRPKYHMVRAFSRFIIGLDYNEFALAIKEARNFRQYFSDRRDHGIQAIQEAVND